MKPLKHSILWIYIKTVVAFFSTGLLFASSLVASPTEPTSETLSGDDIIPLTAFGERANFSPDGSRIVFIGKNYGDAYEVEVATGDMKNITTNLPHQGLHRIQYLPNGDFLVTAPRIYKGANTRADLEMWVLDKSLNKSLQPLGEKPLEGIAISKKRNLIAWTASAPGVTLQKGEPWQILFNKPTTRYIADISYHNGSPSISNKREIMAELPNACHFIEPQDFRDNDNELVFSCLHFSGQNGMQVSVMGYKLDSGKYITYRSQPDEYNEVEGLSLDGDWATVECGKQNKPGIPPLEICLLELKPNGAITRLFTGTPEGVLDEMSNPVVSPDGKWVAFQKSARSGTEYGEGLGLYIVKIAE